MDLKDLTIKMWSYTGFSIRKLGKIFKYRSYKEFSPNSLLPNYVSFFHIGSDRNEIVVLID